MRSWFRKVLNNPLGYTTIGGVLAYLIIKVLAVLGNALLAIDYTGWLEESITTVGKALTYPIPLGSVVVLVVVYVGLFWLVRKRMDLWPFGGVSRNLPRGNALPSRDSLIVLHCIGWKPPTNHDEQFTMLENSKLRFELTRLLPGQNYTFYIRFWSEGRAPRWIGITNSPRTAYTSPNGDEVSLTETTNARPNTDIRFLELIRTRFPDFAGSSAVIDRLRLRGDAANLAEVEMRVTVY
jgi:hypothetical protein